MEGLIHKLALYNRRVAMGESLEEARIASAGAGYSNVSGGVGSSNFSRAAASETMDQQTRAGSPVFTPTTFDTNIVIITAALLFVLICALGMNALIKCVLSWTRRLGPLQADGPHSSFMQRRRRSTTGMNKAEIKLLPITIYHNRQPSSNTQKESFGSSHSYGGSHSHGKLLQSKQADHDHLEDTSQQTLDCQCPICLSDFQDGDKVRVLPLCNHGFHMSCVDPWLSNHSSCPTCRAELITPIASKNNNPMSKHEFMKKSTQVQLEILISPAGTLTPTIYRVLPSPAASSLQSST